MTNPFFRITEPPVTKNDQFSDYAFQNRYSRGWAPKRVWEDWWAGLKGDKDVSERVIDLWEQDKGDQTFMVLNHEGQVKNVGIKSGRSAYPYDLSNMTTIEDIFGQYAGRLRNGPLTPYDAYRKNGMFRRAVNLRADTLAKIPFSIYKGEKEIFNSEFNQKYPRPLRWMNGDKSKGHASFRRLLKKTEMSLVMYNRAAWGFDMTNGVMKGLRWWAPRYWEPQYDDNSSTIIGVHRSVGKQKVQKAQWPLEYVALFFVPDPDCESGSDDRSSDGATAAIHASVLYGMDTFLEGHVRRGLLKAALIRVPRNTEKEERRKINTRFRRLMGGTGPRHWTTQADALEVQELGEGLKELSSGVIEQAQAQYLMTTLGIPHGLMASGQTNAKATAEEDNLHFYDKTVIPRAIFMQEEINEEVLLPLGFRMVFNIDRLDVRKKVLLEEAKERQELINGKQLVSRRYVRVAMGIESAVDGGKNNDPWLEEELEEDRKRQVELMQAAPGGDGEGGNKPDTEDPRHAVGNEQEGEETTED